MSMLVTFTDMSIMKPPLPPSCSGSPCARDDQGLLGCKDRHRLVLAITAVIIIIILILSIAVLIVTAACIEFFYNGETR